MFKENKYTAKYYSIINNAVKRGKQDGYFERHHIVPKSLGGKDIVSNLVWLTPREHLLCHLNTSYG